MKKLLLSALIATAPVTAAHAQMGFMTGLIMGSAISSPSDPKHSPGGPGDVIYRGVFDPTKKFDPARIYIGTVAQRNGSMVDAFATLTRKPDDWDIIEIRRVPFGDGSVFALWFVYYPKDRTQ